MSTDVDNNMPPEKDTAPLSMPCDKQDTADKIVLYHFPEVYGLAR